MGWEREICGWRSTRPIAGRASCSSRRWRPSTSSRRSPVSERRRALRGCRGCDGGSGAKYLATSAPVGEYLADQLMLPLALAGRGAFRALGLSRHAQTNMEVIQQFLPIRFEVKTAEEGGMGGIGEGREVRGMVQMKRSLRRSLKLQSRARRATCFPMAESWPSALRLRVPSPRSGRRFRSSPG
jgi:hypothetical protein